jgi:DNA-binding NarL/FixJ family response regulator
MVASTITAVLQLNGYEVRSFANSLEALEAARTVKPDMVIADVVMPELSPVDVRLNSGALSAGFVQGLDKQVLVALFSEVRLATGSLIMSSFCSP